MRTKNVFVVSYTLNEEFNERALIRTDGKKPDKKLVEQKLDLYLKRTKCIYSFRIDFIEPFESKVKNNYVDLGHATKTLKSLNTPLLKAADKFGASLEEMFHAELQSLIASGEIAEDAADHDATFAMVVGSIAKRLG